MMQPICTSAVWLRKWSNRRFTHSSSSLAKSAHAKWRLSKTESHAASDLYRSIVRNQPLILWRASNPPKSISLLVGNSLRFSSTSPSLPADLTTGRIASSPTSLSRTSQLALTMMDLPQCLQSTERSSLLKFSSTKIPRNQGTVDSSASRTPKTPRKR